MSEELLQDKLFRLGYEQGQADERARLVKALVRFRDNKEGTISRRVIEQAIEAIEAEDIAEITGEI